MKKLVVLALSIFAAVTVSNAQVCALKSNVLTLINGTVNMAAEFSFAPQWTIDLSGTAVVKDFFDSQVDLNGWNAIGEVRYYLCKAFNGHHFGAYAQANRFGWGSAPIIGVEGMHHDVKGAGLGLSYGYYFKLNTYWGIDTNIGAAAYGAYSNEIKSAGKVLGWKCIPRAQVSVCYKF